MNQKRKLQRDSLGPRIPDEARQAACLVIARFRKALDTTLGVPEWQECIKAAVDSLGLPGQRQGVSFVQAVLSLPLESKRDLVLKVFETHSGGLKRRTADTLARAWGFTGFNGCGAGMPLSQWEDFKRRLALKLASHYRSYKNGQTLLYQTYEYIATQAAKEVCRAKSRLEDCEQEGALGLLQAIDRIEPDKPFSSYAFHWTRRRVRNYLLKNSLPISAPVNLISKVTQSEKTDAVSPLDAKSVTLALNCLQQPHVEFSDEALSSERFAAESETEILSPIAAAARADVAEMMDKALSHLSSKQREVLAMRFGVLNQEAVDTLQDIARATGISRQQVARREKRALIKLEGMFSHLANELA